MPVPAPCPPHAAPRGPALWPPGNPILRGVWAWGHVTAAKALGLRTPAAVRSPPAVPAPQSGAQAHGAEAGRARAGPGRGHRALPGGAAQVRQRPEGAAARVGGSVSDGGGRTARGGRKAAADRRRARDGLLRSCPRPSGATSAGERSPWPGLGALGLPAFLSPAPPRGDPAGEPLLSNIDTTVL
ncbi:Phospholipid-Transporting Atpase Ik [Manis pentadactyla]|nr:Phospholipid-Transporting Atpase Ik [Manis pentadactyla]